METEYHYIEDLHSLTPVIPEDTIISRTFHSDEQLRGILFGFAPGQELSEHTSAKPAVLHFLRGEADLTLGEDSMQARAGTWVSMPAHLPHSITARTEVLMLLVMLEKGS